MMWPKKHGVIELTRSGWTPFFVSSVFFGFAAGLVGGLLSATYLLPADSGSASTLTVWRDRGTAARLGSDSAEADAPVIADQSAVLFFAAKSVSGDPLADAYLPDEALASGAVLTSDGWLLTGSQALVAVKGKPAKDLAALVGGRVYAVERVLRDSYSGVVFAKIAAADLPVVSFGDAAALVPGESVYTLDAGFGPRHLSMLGFGAPADASGHGPLFSSEVLSRYLRLQGETPMPGAMIFNRRGEAVAVFGGLVEPGLLAAPLDSFIDRMSAILGNQNIDRPLLGVHYLDLGSLVGLNDDRDFLHKGALVFGSADGSIPAVAKRSPAAEAGLRAGDIIVSVDSDDVTAKRTLSEIISEYDPQDRVSLVVRRGVFPGGLLSVARNGALITVEVVLGGNSGR
ncbi:MAG: PDZ domain-containing protein [Patescibacteria group bacterium]|jgi:serine protease Do